MQGEGTTQSGGGVMGFGGGLAQGEGALEPRG